MVQDNETYLKQDIGPALAEAMQRLTAQANCGDPTSVDNIQFIVDCLNDYAARPEAERKAKEMEKQLLAEAAIMADKKRAEDAAQAVIDAEQAEINQLEAKLKQIAEGLANMSPETDETRKPDAQKNIAFRLNMLAEVVKKITGADNVYCARHRPNFKQHQDPEGNPVLRYTKRQSGEGRTFNWDKCEYEGSGLTGCPEMCGNSVGKEEGVIWDCFPEEGEPQVQFVPRVLMNEKLKIFGQPRLGSFAAFPLVVKDIWGKGLGTKNSTKAFDELMKCEEEDQAARDAVDADRAAAKEERDALIAAYNEQKAAREAALEENPEAEVEELGEEPVEFDAETEMPYGADAVPSRERAEWDHQEVMVVVCVDTLPSNKTMKQKDIDRAFAVVNYCNDLWHKHEEIRMWSLAKFSKMLQANKDMADRMEELIAAIDLKYAELVAEIPRDSAIRNLDVDEFGNKAYEPDLWDANEEAYARWKSVRQVMMPFLLDQGRECAQLPAVPPAVAKVFCIALFCCGVKRDDLLDDDGVVSWEEIALVLSKGDWADPDTVEKKSNLIFNGKKNRKRGEAGPKVIKKMWEKPVPVDEGDKFITGGPSESAQKACGIFVEAVLAYAETKKAMRRAQREYFTEYNRLCIEQEKELEEQEDIDSSSASEDSEGDEF